MTDKRAAGLDISADASGALKAFNQVKQSADSMADGVVKAGKKAGDGIDGIGTGAAPAAQKLDKATSSIIASVQRTTAAMQAGQKGTASYFEALASQRGVDANTLKPYLDQLRAVEIAQGNVGVSAKQTAAAMRGVPAQFTDIITSLQGGQAPLTVMLQQGGQLKDMFGGVGNAARALGSYVLGLVNPFTVLAAAAGAVGLAWYQGSKESEAYSRALILSGNAVGTTSGQMQIMARSIAAVSGTQGAAAEGLALFAQSANTSTQDLQRFTASALQFAKATGEPVKDIAKNFADLAKDPLAATLKLNEGMNYLSKSTYLQIEALVKQGKATEAAALAQNGYSDAMSQRSPELLKNIGAIEYAWKEVAAATASAWNYMKSIGREAGSNAQLQTLQAAIATATSKRATISSDSAFAPELDKQIAKLREKESVLQSTVREELKAADAQAQQKRQVDALAESQKEGQKYLTQEQRMREDITRQTNLMVTAGASQAEIEKRISLIRSSYAQKGLGGENEIAGYKAKSAAADDYIKRLKDLTVETPKLTEAENQAYKLQEELRGSITGTARAMKEKALAAAQGLVVQEQEILKLEKWRDRIKKSKDEYDQMTAAIGKSADSVNQRAAAQEAANAVFGKGTAAIEQMNVAELKHQMAQAQGSDRYTDTYIANLEALIQAKERNVKALQALDAKTLQTTYAKKSMSDFDSLIGAQSGAQLNGLFNGATDGAMKFVTALNLVAEVAKKTQEALKANEQINSGDPAKMAAEQARITAQSALTTVTAYGSMAGSLKTYAKEGSKAYQGLYTAEKIFRAFELASAISNMATKSGLLTAFIGTKLAGDAAMTASTTASGAAEIATTVAVGQATAVTGVANQSGGDPYSAFPRMAAMAAIMAGLGFLVGGMGGGGGGGGAAPVNEGTGTVFGDSSAKSKSIGSSLDILNKTEDMALQYSRAMAASLRSIESGIAGVTNLYLRGGGTAKLTDNITTGKFDTGLSKAMSFGSELLGPVLGGLMRSINTALFGKKISITGTGISAGSQSLQQIAENGFQGNYYADVNTKKKAFGITYSSKNSTQLSGLDSELGNQFAKILGNFGSSMSIAADLLGQDLSTTSSRINSYAVNLGRINLQGLTGDQIQEKLSAVFGAEADKMAQAVIPGFEKMQAVGEGYYETVIRMANQYELVSTYMDRLGGSLRSMGTQAAIVANDLINAFGGIDNYTSQVSDFYTTYYSEAERAAKSTKELATVMSNLGLAVPGTLQGYRDLVNAQDLSSDAGRKTYAALMQLAPAFSTITKAAEDAQQSYAEAIARTKPANTVADMKASVGKQFDAVGLQVQDGTRLQETLIAEFGPMFSIMGMNFGTRITGYIKQFDAIPNMVAASLPKTVSEFEKLVEAQDATTEAGQKARLALMALAPAFVDLIQAQEQATAAVASQRQTLQDQLDQLTGNTTTLRERERAALDDSNRALYDQIQALKEQQTAAAAAAQAQSQVTAQRSGLQDQLDRLMGNTAALRERERNALDSSNRALYDQIQALQEQQAASEAAAQAAAAVASQRSGLQDQLDQLLGNTAALRERERNALDVSNRALYDQIQALQEQQAASEAATQAEQARAEAMKAAGRTVEEEIKRLRGINGQSNNAAYLHAQFATLTGQARAGDSAALAQLPEVTQALEQASRTTATSALDVERMRGWLANSLAATLTALGLDAATLADDSTPTGLRLNGDQGTALASTDASTAAAASQAAATLSTSSQATLLEEVRALRAEVVGLRAEALATANSTSKVATTLDRVTRGTDSIVTTQG